MNLKEIREETKKLNLLYAEDEEEIREQTFSFFSNFFKKTDVAKNGKEALELFIKNSYDIIVTDLRMPIMNGEELMNEAKKLKPGVITVAMTGLSEDRERERIKSDYYITKPLTTEMLVEIMEQILKKR